MAFPPDVVRRCRAIHPSLNLQCEGESSELTVHIEDHWATDVHDRTLRHSWFDPDVSPARDVQIGGSHYSQHEIQVWDIVDEYGLGYVEGSVLKYLLRDKADRLEDLKKARHCLDRLIELEGVKRRGEA